MKKLYSKIIYLLFISSLCLSASVFAQQESVMIRGTITDKNDKLGLPGASVLEMDKDNRIITGTITDMNGNYSLKISNKKIKFHSRSLVIIQLFWILMTKKL